MQVLRIRSKFWGKSMEFQPEGEVGAKYFIYKIFRTTNTFTFSYFSANTLLQSGWIWILAQTSTKLKSLEAQPRFKIFCQRLWMPFSAQFWIQNRTVWAKHHRFWANITDFEWTVWVKRGVIIQTDTWCLIVITDKKPHPRNKLWGRNYFV